MEVGSVLLNNGKWVKALSPNLLNISDININFICTALNRNPRYLGHSDKFWSVGHHSVLVYEILKIIYPDAPIRLKLRALTHDFSEAFLNDVPAPVKLHAVYREVSTAHDILQDRINKLLNCYPADYIHEITGSNAFDEAILLKDCDTLALFVECQYLFISCFKILPLPDNYKFIKNNIFIKDYITLNADSLLSSLEEKVSHYKSAREAEIKHLSTTKRIHKNSLPSFRFKARGRTPPSTI